MRLFRQLATFVRDEDGPTAVEYAVMLALIIVVSIAAITNLGTAANPNKAVGQLAVNLATVNGVNEADAFAQATITVGSGQYAGLVARYNVLNNNQYFAALSSVAGGGFQAVICSGLAIHLRAAPIELSN